MPVNYPEACKMREERKPSPVRLHHVPDWFRRRLLKVFGTWRGQTSASLVFYHFQNHVMAFPNWIDHWGSTRLPDGSVAFISEPYSRPEDVRDSVAALAHDLGCSWCITGNSEWFPGSTIRIELFEGPDSTPISDLERKGLR